jgi:hypothetical protein
MVNGLLFYYGPLPFTIITDGFQFRSASSGSCIFRVNKEKRIS